MEKNLGCHLTVIKYGTLNSNINIVNGPLPVNTLNMKHEKYEHPCENIHAGMKAPINECTAVGPLQSIWLFALTKT